MPRPQKPKSPLGAILQSLKPDAPAANAGGQRPQQRPPFQGQRPRRPFHTNPNNPNHRNPNAGPRPHGAAPANHPNKSLDSANNASKDRSSRPSYQYPKFEHKRKGARPQNPTQRQS